ncbi:hypothetical protein XELAEV_18004117mg [Xenopus laevis]|uniref:Uncharacterized protein n=1 Tax=Xenopus laevis TaxID=8355 RepID=A0A974GYW9_XENLA|nr:hypothetical protein XELAEV_18004117mg [Xenopus laevis]
MPRPSHEADYRTTPPIDLRNRFGPLYTPYRRRTQTDLEEVSDEEDDSAGGSKPALAQPATQSAVTNRDDSDPQAGQDPQSTLRSSIYPSHTPPLPTHPAPASSASDFMSSFPESEQPMTQALFKSFMMSFACERKNNILDVRGDLQALAGYMSNHIKETYQKITRLENRIVEMTAARNVLVDAHKDLMKENKWIKEKLADGEDRNRRNNVKIRGVSETVSTTELKDYVKNLLHTAFPTLRLTRIHFFHVKEMLLDATREGRKLPEEYKDLSIYQDLSQATPQTRRSFSEITTTLRYKKIPYAWGFPPKLIINDNNTQYVIRSPKEGHKLLSKWNIPIFVPKDSRRDKPSRLPTSTKPTSIKPSPMDTTQPLPETDRNKGATAGT